MRHTWLCGYSIYIEIRPTEEKGESGEDGAVKPDIGRCSEIMMEKMESIDYQLLFVLVCGIACAPLVSVWIIYTCVPGGKEATD